MKKLEKLHPQEYGTLLKNAKELFTKLLEEKRASLKNAPEGKLRVSKSGTTVQYFVRTADGKHNGSYLKKTDVLITQLAQKEYDEDAAAALESEIALIEDFLQRSRFSGQFQTKLHQSKQPLASQLTLSAEEYTKRWMHIPFEALAFKEGQSRFFVTEKLAVRSKTEAGIAESLSKNHIPFRYEPRLKLKAYTVHPDFICLNVRTRTEFVWEHFGMMDDTEYAAKNVQKLHAYQADGWIPGRNLIITMETKKSHIDAISIQQIIEAYLL